MAQSGMWSKAACVEAKWYALMRQRGMHQFGEAACVDGTKRHALKNQSCIMCSDTHRQNPV